jgi:WD40 repeat protein
MCLRGLSLTLLGVACLFLPARAQPPEKSPPVNERPLGKGVRCVAFSQDGKLLVAGFGEPAQRGRAILWDVASATQLWSHPENDGVPAVAFAPDGKTIAIGVYDHSAKLLDAGSGRVLKTLSGHTGAVRAAAFSPDGRTLVTGGWDKTVRLWDVALGTERQQLEWPADRIYTTAFSPGGRWLLASGGPALVWDAAGGAKKLALDRKYFHMEWAIFADDDWLVTGDNHGTVRAWNIATGQERVRFHDMAGVRRLAFSPTTRRLAVATHFYHGINVYDFTLQEPSANEKERLARLLAKLDDDDYTVREAAGRDIVALGFVVEPELRRLMAAPLSAEARIRCRRLREELLTKPLETLFGHKGEIDSLTFSPDSRLLASGSVDGTVRLWDVQKLKGNARVLTAQEKAR